MKIPIIFLGTSQAIPTENRNHTSILLQYKDENILIDCGEGTQRQFRKAKINPCKLTRILITHWHGDHILGLPGLLQTLQLNNYSKTLYIYGPKGTKKFLNIMMSLFVNEGKINIKVSEIETGKVFETKDFLVEAISMQHTTKCLAYSFEEKEKTRINKEKIKNLNPKEIQEIIKGKTIISNNKKINIKNISHKEKGRKISFIFDTKINKNIEKIAKNSDLLISESTYLKPEEELAERYKHLTAEQAGEIAKKTKSKELILTHISQRYDKKEKEILEEAKKKFKNTILAHDLMRIEI